jgi:hypothetical protein
LSAWLLVMASSFCMAEILPQKSLPVSRKSIFHVFALKINDIFSYDGSGTFLT